MEKQFKVGEQLMKALFQYLGTKPYAEVFQIIEALQKVTPVENGEKTVQDFAP